MPALDPAVLENRLRAWVGSGSQGPSWHGSYVTVDGCSVLIVEVGPPRWGDPIYPLRKHHERVSAGLLLVRHAGSVEPAGPVEMDGLNARARRRAVPRVAVELSLAANAVPLRTLEVAEGAVEEWLEGRRRVLLRSVEPKPPSGPFGADPMPESTMQFAQAAARMREQLAGILSEPEDRTEEQYRGQVERYIEACREVLP